MIEIESFAFAQDHFWSLLLMNDDPAFQRNLPETPHLKLDTVDFLALAQHAMALDQPMLTAKLALTAANQALSHKEPTVARQMLEEGLAVLSLDDPERGPYLLALGEACRLEGDGEAASEAYEAALAGLEDETNRLKMLLARARVITGDRNPFKASQKTHTAAHAAQKIARALGDIADALDKLS
jgi:tetratricopeptide (TPR) repeat protein